MQTQTGHQGHNSLKIVTGPLPDSEEATLLAMAKEMLAEGGPKAIRYDEPADTKGGPQSIVYTARHELISEALNDPARFCLDHYDRAIPDTKFFLTSDIEEYQRRRRLIWQAFGERRHAGRLDDFGVGNAVDEVTTMIVDDLNRRTGPVSQFDILREFNVLVTYYVSRRVFGVKGTRRPSLLIRLVQIAKWIQTRRKLNLTPASQEAHSMLCAAQLMIGQLFINFENRSKVLKSLGESASSEINGHIAHALESEKLSPSGSIITDLLAVKSADALKDIPEADLDRNIHAILLEFVGTMVVLVGNGFIKMLLHMQESGRSFADMAEQMRAPDKATAFINECMRIRCPTGRLKRVVAEDTDLCGVPVQKGQYVCLMVPEGCHDPRAFPDPERFDPDRDPRLYIHFSTHEGPHRCLGPYWSREVLRQMFLKLEQLDKLAFTTGKNGGLKYALKGEDSWPVTFSPRASG